MRTAAPCSITARRRSSVPSTRPAANSTASSVNPSAEPSSYPQIPRTRPFFEGALKHYYSWLVLEHPPDRLDVEAPECRDVGRGVVLFGRNVSVNREAGMCECIVHCHSWVPLFH